MQGSDLMDGFFMNPVGQWGCNGDFSNNKLCMIWVVLENKENRYTAKITLSKMINR